MAARKASGSSWRCSASWGDWTGLGGCRCVRPSVAAVGRSGPDGIYSLTVSPLPNLFQSVATRSGTRLCVLTNLACYNCHH